jgi:uncharacterized protein YabE (DUF348 family)
MSVERVENPTTIRELTRYVEHHTDLDTSYNARHEQVVVVGRPGNPESPAALREILGSDDFEMQAQTVASRGRWLGVINASEDGGEHD